MGDTVLSAVVNAVLQSNHRKNHYEKLQLNWTQWLEMLNRSLQYDVWLRLNLGVKVGYIVYILEFECVLLASPALYHSTTNACHMHCRACGNWISV